MTLTPITKRTAKAVFLNQWTDIFCAMDRPTVDPIIANGEIKADRAKALLIFEPKVNVSNAISSMVAGSETDHIVARIFSGDQSWE